MKKYEIMFKDGTSCMLEADLYETDASRLKFYVRNPDAFAEFKYIRFAIFYLSEIRGYIEHEKGEEGGNETI